MRNVATIDEMIMNTQGFTGIKNRAISKTVSYYTKKFKDHFGTDMIFTYHGEVKVVTEWIKEKDPNFKNHISNPYMLKTPGGVDPIINTDFILKLDKATYVFVSGKDADSDKRENDRSLYLYIFGKKMYKYFKEIKTIIEEKQGTSKMMYNISARADDNSNWWTCVGSKLTPRPMNTLFFEKDKKNKILNHLNKWVANEEIYSSRGLTFKTGILLYGKAGTGKSSLASAIANYLKCGLITIDTTTFHNLNISEVVESINADDERYVILIDEIDTIFTSRDNEDITDKAKEKTSKLLSLLDSQQSPNNVVFVATTNYIDRLDKAVIRKGRFDLIVELGDIDRESALEMCHSFNMTDDQITSVMSQYKGDINPADLQSKILETIAKKADIDEM